ncbi:hypothetical protein [Geomicrobium sp. JCM 19038]|uniref:hypothetical protein n=1 Tax=Geomicrobium sp. JCM 19038 TaxID=1460635 RepID=UPI00045F1508|nr:hypothetical protein [Geomicrobium sp. JCM 19038]GAK08659.1 hypothetical protein JCM19038_2448 [Geomicrobium sp. JCM 19038]
MKEKTVAIIGGTDATICNLLNCVHKSGKVLVISERNIIEEEGGRITWRETNVFSLTDLKRALKGVDVVVFVNQWERPTARLIQAENEDLNVMLADNIAQAAVLNGLDQIVCVSGDRQGQEIEHVLTSYGIDVTTVQFGRLVGAKKRKHPSRKELVYKEVMIETNLERQKRSKSTRHLKKMWVRVTTNTASASPEPIISTIVHSLLSQPIRLAQLIDMSLSNVATKKQIAKQAITYQKSDVCSIQRIQLPEHRDASWAANRYIDWLEEVGSPFLRTMTSKNKETTIYLFRIPVLRFMHSEEHSDNGRMVFHISGGLFAKKHNKGYIEFRQVINHQTCIIAIQEYEPSLPWFLYVRTQATVHEVVMALFRMHVQKQK